MFVPEAAYAYIQSMGIDPGDAPATSGTTGGVDNMYAAWQAHMREYAAKTCAAGTPSTYFYIALGLPQDNYADKIDYHPDLPMMVPVSGTPVKVLGVFPDKKAADVAMEEDREHVHLLYKLKLQGCIPIYKFLEFMAEHNMMEKAE